MVTSLSIDPSNLLVPATTGGHAVVWHPRDCGLVVTLVGLGAVLAAAWASRGTMAAVRYVEHRGLDLPAKVPL